MTDRRPLYLLAAFVVVIGGFTVMRITGGTTTASTPGPKPAPTTTLTTSPPSSLANGWNAGLTRINDTENALFSSPDPAGVAAIMEPTCSCYKTTKDRLTTLQQKGWRVAGANLVITSSDVVKVDSADRLEILVNVSVPGFPVVDAGGNTMQDGGAATNGALLYILHQGSDNIWRLTDRRSASS